jgi:hypothetical protein
MPRVTSSSKPKEYVSVYTYKCGCCEKEVKSSTPVVKLMCCNYFMDHIEEEKTGQLDLFDVTGVEVPPVNPLPPMEFPTFNFFKRTKAKIEQLDLFEVTGVFVNG